MSMTEWHTKQYIILNVVHGGYVTSPPVNWSMFTDIAIRNGRHGDESLTQGTSNPDTIPIKPKMSSNGSYHYDYNVDLDELPALKKWPELSV